VTADTEPAALVPLPEGWARRLPAGPSRRVRVSKREVGLPDGTPWCVDDGRTTRLYAACLIEGPSRLVHNPDGYAAYVETEASILVR
jgi:hypothetical protein